MMALGDIAPYGAVELGSCLCHSRAFLSNIAAKWHRVYHNQVAEDNGRHIPVVSQFASELLDAFEQKIQTETLPISLSARQHLRSVLNVDLTAVNASPIGLPGGRWHLSL
jgi:hypothetical protein